MVHVLTEGLVLRPDVQLGSAVLFMVPVLTEGLGVRPGVHLGSASLFTIPVLTKGLKLPEEAEEVLPLCPSHPALPPHRGGSKELTGPRGFQIRRMVHAEAWARKGPLCPRLRDRPEGTLEPGCWRAGRAGACESCSAGQDLDFISV